VTYRAQNRPTLKVETQVWRNGRWQDPIQPIADAEVATNVEETDTERAELCEQVAHSRLIVHRDGLLVISVPALIVCGRFGRPSK